MDREEMTETILETVLEATIGSPITSVIGVVIKKGLCLREVVLLHRRLAKDLAALVEQDPEVVPEARPVAEPELLPVTMCRCQKCRSTFLKVVYLI